MKSFDAAEELNFIHAMINRSHRRIDPAAPIMIAWGAICLIGYSATHWLMHINAMHQLGLMWGSLQCAGILFSAVFVWRKARYWRSLGINTYVSRQLVLIWLIIGANGTLWYIYGPQAGIVSAQAVGFLWAALFAIGLSMMGIVYSKEWLVAGICVSAAIMFAGAFQSLSLIILGTAMGLGCIVPGAIAHVRFHRLLAHEHNASE
jgi:hypothetical protein